MLEFTSKYIYLQENSVTEVLIFFSPLREGSRDHQELVWFT